jgi:hypothetical protein
MDRTMETCCIATIDAKQEIVTRKKGDLVWYFYRFFFIFCQLAAAPMIPRAPHTTTIDGDEVGVGMEVGGTVVGFRVVVRGVDGADVCCVITSVGATVSSATV